MTEHDHETRQVDRTARRGRLRRRLLAVGSLVTLALGAVGWWLFYRPLSSEERPLVGRWEAQLYTEQGKTYEWEFKSNHTVHRRLVNRSGQVTMDDVLGWSVSEGKLTFVRRHPDWASRLKSGNFTLTDPSDAALVWDGPDRFAFVRTPQSKPFVLVRTPETGSKQSALSP